MCQYEVSGGRSSTRRLVYRLREAGHDAVHTLDLPRGNCTTDTEIKDISEREQRVVITKDADFVNSFMVSHRPYKLLLASMGNITNAALEAIFVPNIALIVNGFLTNDYIELMRTTFIIHM